MYSLDDLEKARAELQEWSNRWDNYSGNNPDKYQADIQQARRNVEMIEQALKTAGVIPKSDRELLWERLDKAFPKARSKEIVELDDKRYMRRFWPKERSRSKKTVTEWCREWEELAD